MKGMMLKMKLIMKVILLLTMVSGPITSNAETVANPNQDLADVNLNIEAYGTGHTAMWQSRPGGTQGMWIDQWIGLYNGVSITSSPKTLSASEIRNKGYGWASKGSMGAVTVMPNGLQARVHWPNVGSGTHTLIFVTTSGIPGRHYATVPNAGSAIVRVTRVGTVETAVITHAGVDLVTVHGTVAGQWMNVTIGHVRGSASHWNPVVTASPDIDTYLGYPAEFYEGITAHWGKTTANTIPSMGSVTLSDVSRALADTLIDAEGNYTRIGKYDFDYIICDDHSLSTDPVYSADNTQTTATRSITVRTTASPMLSRYYPAGTVAADGYTSIAGQNYNPLNMALSVSGGESGWTSRPLSFQLSPAGIVGSFRSVLTVGALPPSVNLNAWTTVNNYHIESDTVAGTLVHGVLTADSDISIFLSPEINSYIKLDKTAPVANADYTGGFDFADLSYDALSQISVLRPTQIAFTSPTASMTPPTSGWEDLASHTHNTSGTYDVWVWATDKAGNEHKVKVYASLYMGGEVHITKDTDLGAVLHEAACLNFEHITIEPGCGLGCNLGLTPHVVEQSTLNYNLTLTNLASVGDADGTFVDYLPEGMVVSTMPIVTPVGSATVTYALETLPPYTGRYKVSGSYTGLAPGGQIVIDIATDVPLFDTVTPAKNLLINQASTDWNINSGALTGTNESNYANHKIQSPGVDTLFTKVGADAPSVGIPGVEFTLYRWDGALAPTTAEQNHIVDTTVLIDSSLPGGDWVRVKYDGEDATSLTDIFVSATSPLGEVDLGNLPEGVYSLIETKAPSGYELPVGQWILTVDPSKNDTGASDWKLEFVGKSTSMMPPAVSRTTGGPEPTYQVINIRPFSIGISGLGGTKGLLLSGFVIMAIAGNVYLRSSDKGRKTKGANNE